MISIRLRKFANIIFLVLISTGLLAQNIYKTKIYEYKEEDPAWQKMEQDLVHLMREVKELSAELNVLNPREKELMIDILFNIRTGNDSLLTERLKKPEARGILDRNDVKVDQVHRLTHSIREVLLKQEALRDLYRKKRVIEYDIPLYPKLKEIQSEISKYGFYSGEKILFVESGSLAFAKALGMRINHSKIYLSDSDPMELKTMFYLMHWDEEMQDIVNERSNEYYIVEGTEGSTGIGDQIFDKIIFRNSFRHITDKDAILRSVKESMNAQSELIFCERFQEDCEESPCEGLMRRTEFRDAFEGLELRLVESNYFHNSEGHRFWLYWLQLDA